MYVSPSGIAKCPNGSVANDQWTGCTLVSPGTFADGSSIIYRGEYTQAGTPCANGSYSTRGASACSLCAEGSYAPRSGSTACLECGRNHYCPIRGSDAPVHCAPGSYMFTNGATQCLLCEIGKVGDGTGCTDCNTSERLYSPAPGGAVCKPCVGQFDADTDTCTACGLGRYFDAALATCVTCPFGTVNVLDIQANSSSACSLTCPSPTQYASAPSICLESPLGYEPSLGSTSPLPCTAVTLFFATTQTLYYTNIILTLY